jgi:hypothetical protein
MFVLTISWKAADKIDYEGAREQCGAVHDASLVGGYVFMAV